MNPIERSRFLSERMGRGWQRFAEQHSRRIDEIVELRLFERSLWQRIKQAVRKVVGR